MGLCNICAACLQGTRKWENQPDEENLIKWSDHHETASSLTDAVVKECPICVRYWDAYSNKEQTLLVRLDSVRNCARDGPLTLFWTEHDQTDGSILLGILPHLDPSMPDQGFETGGFVLKLLDSSGRPRDRLN